MRQILNKPIIFTNEHAYRGLVFALAMIVIIIMKIIIIMASFPTTIPIRPLFDIILCMLIYFVRKELLSKTNANYSCLKVLFNVNLVVISIKLISIPLIYIFFPDFWVSTASTILIFSPNSISPVINTICNINPGGNINPNSTTLPSSSTTLPSSSTNPANSINPISGANAVNPDGTRNPGYSAHPNRPIRTPNDYNPRRDVSNYTYRGGKLWAELKDKSLPPYDPNELRPRDYEDSYKLYTGMTQTADQAFKQIKFEIVGFVEKFSITGKVKLSEYFQLEQYSREHPNVKSDLESIRESNLQNTIRGKPRHLTDRGDAKFNTVIDTRLERIIWLEKHMLEARKKFIEDPESIIEDWPEKKNWVIREISLIGRATVLHTVG